MNSSNFVLGIDVDFLQDKDKFSYWYERMPEHRKNKIDRFRPMASKILSLGAGIVLERGLEMLDITDPVILEDQNEKPYIQGAAGINFNLSHSGKIAVCAFSDTPVGIDVQEPERFNRNLMDFVYKDEEIKYIKYRSENQSDIDRICTKMWTIKESIMKYYGKGLSMDPRKLFVDMEHGERAFYDGEALENIYFTGFEHDEYCVTVCSGYENFSDEIIFVKGE